MRHNKIIYQLVLVCLMFLGGVGESWGQDSLGNWVGWGRNDYSQSANYMKYTNNFREVFAGSSRIIAIHENGDAMTWGYGDSDSQRIPTEALGAKSYSVDVSRIFAIKHDGSVFQWGNEDLDMPIEAKTNIHSIATGPGSHSLALTKDSTVIAWGVVSGSADGGQNTVPLNLKKVIQIGKGYNISVALQADSSIMVWGSYYGQTITDNTPSHLTNITSFSASGSNIIAIKGDSTVARWGDVGIPYSASQKLTSVVKVVAGDDFGLALKSDGTLISWSEGEVIVPIEYQNVKFKEIFGHGNLAGAIKDNGEITTWSSVPVFSFKAKELKGISKISGGITTAAITPQGQILMWGKDIYSSSSNGNNVHYSDFDYSNIRDIAVIGLSLFIVDSVGDVRFIGNYQSDNPIYAFLTKNVVRIEAGYNHIMTLGEDSSTTVIWGSNNHGQAAMPYYGAHKIIDIAAGSYHCLALLDNGKVIAWGDNTYGQIDVPTGLNNVVSVTAGAQHSVALKADGTISIWGSGPATESIPQNLGIIKSIKAGGLHNIALNTDGVTMAWGDNTYGQTDIPNTSYKFKNITAGYYTSFGWGGLYPYISSSLNDSIINSDSVWINIDFYEPVSGFSSNDIKTENCTVAYLHTSDSISFQLLLLATSTEKATITAQVIAGSVSDSYKETNFASNIFKIICWPRPNSLSGRIFEDINGNCLYDSLVDKPLQGYIVKSNNSFTYSKADGTYQFLIDSGSYDLSVIYSEAEGLLIDTTCIGSYQINLDTFGITIDTLNFPLQITECPVLSVDVTSNRRRRCFLNQTTLTYKNTGFAHAENAKVYLRLPEYVSLLSANSAFTLTADSVYVFDIGTLEAGAFGIINIIDSVHCESGITGLDQCTEAWITPTNSCLADNTPPDSTWDNSSVAVEGLCISNTDGVRFIIRNVGDGDMTEESTYRIYESNQLASSNTFQLAKGDSLVIDYGQFLGNLRLEADQVAGHPGSSLPQATVTGCGVGVAFRVSTANLFEQDDAPLEIEIDCLPIIDSFDPNDKMATPQGFTDNRYVKPDTRLEYRIRFQNTGTDTAYKVIVVDTLSNLMDISTFRMGSVSHDYELDISGEGNPVLTWTFNDIDLVDSLTDEPNSHGFIKFGIAPNAGLPDGTIVSNEAEIYFDFNDPIITNDAWVNYYDTVFTTSGYQFGEDLDLPVATLSGATEYTNQPLTISIDVNENASIALSDLNASNANVSDLQGTGKNYSVLVSPINEGEVSLNLPQQSFVDLAGNENLASNTVKTIYDITKPGIDWSYNPGRPFEIQFSLTEPVTGTIELSDIDISGNTVKQLLEENGTYTLVIEPIIGSVSISLKEDLLTDRAGNTNDASQKTIAITASFDEQLSAYTTISPNPTEGRILVDFPWATNGSKTIQVVDMLGRTVLETNTNATSTSIDLGQSQNGTYILRVISERGIATKLFVKQ